MSDMLYDGARIETDADCVVTVRRREWHEAPYFRHGGTTWCWLEDGTPVGDAPGIVSIINDQPLTAQLDKLREENARLREACRAATELSRLQALVDACEDAETINEAISWIDHANGLLAAALAQSEDGP